MGYFYEALTPTNNVDPFYYSNSFAIMAGDIATQQAAFDVNFRNAANNPLNFNTQWSVEYPDQGTADANRAAEIAALRNNARTVNALAYP